MAVKLLKHTPYSSGLQMLSLPCTCLFTYENRSCVQLSWKSHNMQMQITRKTYSVEKKKKKRQAVQALATLTHDTFIFMSPECRILSSTKETTSSFNNDYMLQMNVTNV